MIVDGDKHGGRHAPLGDRDSFPTTNSIQQLGKMGLSLEGTDGVHTN